MLISCVPIKRTNVSGRQLNLTHTDKAQHCTYCYKTPIETFLVNSEVCHRLSEATLMPDSCLKTCGDGSSQRERQSPASVTLCLSSTYVSGLVVAHAPVSEQGAVETRTVSSGRERAQDGGRCWLSTLTGYRLKLSGARIFRGKLECAIADKQRAG